MKQVMFAAMMLLAAQTMKAQVQVARVADDAMVIDRVAEVSKRDLPRDLLRRLVTDDVDLLRGKRADGTYQYAGYERMEASRTSDSFSIQPTSDPSRLSTISHGGEYAYRAIIEMPARRMLVTKNRRLFIDHVEVEYMPQGGSTKKFQTVKVEAWMEPGASRTIDFDEIARQATVRVFARADKDAGYSNVVITLIQARVFDNPDSPYADAVSTAKAILRGLDREDVPSIRAMASRLRDDLRASGITATPPPATIAATPATRSVDVVAPRPTDLAPGAPQVEVYVDLQQIEDLLTGNDAERRDGLDRLHQLVRKLRPNR